MSNSIESDGGEHQVLVNAEGQYSIWPAFREVPRGWTAVGPRGGREDCLAWVEGQWTDMRPKSLREPAAGKAH